MPSRKASSARRSHELSTRRWRTRAAAQREITSYIEGFYNPVRLHSTLGYQAPAVFEATRAT